MSTDRPGGGIDSDTAWIPRMDRPSAGPTCVAAGAAAVLTGMLLGAAQLSSTVFAGAVLIVQLLLIAAWYLGVRPPGRIGVTVVAAGAALAGVGLAAFADDATVAPLAAVVAVAFGATIVAQLLRGAARRQVTEAFGATTTLVVAVVALASTISLHRQAGGPDLLTTCLVAAGAGIVVARLMDLVAPGPNVHYAVSRGVIGIAAGSVAGLIAAVVMGIVTDSLAVPFAALAGWGVALAGILADVAVGFASAGRAMVGEPPQTSPLRPVLGPLLGLAVAAPAGYVFGLRPTQLNFGPAARSGNSGPAARSANVGGTSVSRKRRAGCLGVLIALLVLLLIALAVVDRVAAGVAEQRLAEEVDKAARAENAIPAGTTAEISGYPFLTQVWSGEYDGGRIEMEAVRTEQLTIANVDITVSGLTIPRDILFGAEPHDITASRMRGGATVSLKELATRIGIQGLVLTGGGNRVRFSTPLTIAGFTAQVEGDAAVKLDGDRVWLDIGELSAGGVRVPDQAVDVLRQQLAAGARIPPLPYNLRLTGIRVEGSTVRVTAAADNVALVR